LGTKNDDEFQIVVVENSAGGSKDAILNPAVTMGFAVSTGDYHKLAPYFAAEMLGAFVGAVLVWLHFPLHWKETPDPVSKRACFCTFPAIRNVAATLLSEIIGSFVLVFVVAAIFSKRVGAIGLSGSFGMYLVSCLIWGIGLSIGGTTRFAINPARDLSPRGAHALLPIAGKGDSDWGYASIPVIGPFIGGALAGLLIRLIGF
jgi:glycerol uptake facilitator protein